MWVLWGLIVVDLPPGLDGMLCGVSGRPLERVAVVGESPVRENAACVVDVCSRVAASSWNLL